MKTPLGQATPRPTKLAPVAEGPRVNGEISSVLCDQLEGWDREGGREGDARGKRNGYICMCITDSPCYKAETNTPL